MGRRIDDVSAARYASGGGPDGSEVELPNGSGRSVVEVGCRPVSNRPRQAEQARARPGWSAVDGMASEWAIAIVLRLVPRCQA